MKLIFNTLNEKTIIESTLPGKLFIAAVGILFIAIIGANSENIRAYSAAKEKERQERIKAIKNYIDTKSFPVFNGKYNERKTLLINLIDFDLYKYADIIRFIDSNRYMYGVGVSAIKLLETLNDESYSYKILMRDIYNRDFRVLYFNQEDGSMNIVILEEDGVVAAYCKSKDSSFSRRVMYDNIEQMFFDEAYTVYNYMVKVGKIKDSDY